MEIYNLYNASRKTAWFYLAFGSFSIVLGVAATTMAFISGFDTRVWWGHWIYIIHIAQGILFLNLGISVIKREKCFVKWDDTMIQYLLAGNRNIETIMISEITGIRLKLHEVRIWLNNDTIKKLNLNNVAYEPLIKIKNHFKRLQSTVADTG
jgi:hypothetical protein